jgi:regulator of replication initiation timing
MQMTDKIAELETALAEERRLRIEAEALRDRLAAELDMALSDARAAKRNADALQADTIRAGDERNNAVHEAQRHKDRISMLERELEAARGKPSKPNA